MKKDILAFVVRYCVAFSIVFFASCWTPFEPATNLGGDLISGIDSNATNLTNGYKKLDPIFFAASGGRTFISAGHDTSIFRLQSGELIDHFGNHLAPFAAGRYGDDSVFGYAELHVSSSLLASWRTCDSSADSVSMQLYFDTSGNNYMGADSFSTIQVFLCQRKFYPGVSNELTVVENPLPCTTLAIRLGQPDTVSVSLGPQMIAQLHNAIIDTHSIARYIGSIDTVFGAGRVFDGTDTVFRPDTIVQYKVDTLVHYDSVGGLVSAEISGSAFVQYKTWRSNAGSGDTAFFIDTVLNVDTLDGLGTATAADTVFVKYRTMRFFALDTSFTYDTIKKYIGSVCVKASGGGIVRFSGIPSFRVVYGSSCKDTTRVSPIYSAYWDDMVKETGSIADDSLVVSWQSDRFVEIPINLQPLWDSLKTAGGSSFKIVQDARCQLTIDTTKFEGLERYDTLRTVVYGLLDHRISDSKVHSQGTYDSLLSLANGGRWASVSVHAGQTQVILPLSMYLQSLADEAVRPSTAYLSLFGKPGSHFGRIAFLNPSSIKVTALFSNSHR